GGGDHLGSFGLAGSAAFMGEVFGRGGAAVQGPEVFGGEVAAGALVNIGVHLLGGEHPPAAPAGSLRSGVPAQEAGPGAAACEGSANNPGNRGVVGGGLPGDAALGGEVQGERVAVHPGVTAEQGAQTPRPVRVEVGLAAD